MIRIKGELFLWYTRGTGQQKDPCGQETKCNPIFKKTFSFDTKEVEARRMNWDEMRQYVFE